MPTSWNEQRSEPSIEHVLDRLAADRVKAYRLLSQEDFDSVTICREALHSAQRDLADDNHPDIIDTREELAELYFRFRRFQTAVETANDAFNQRYDKLGGQVFHHDRIMMRTMRLLVQCLVENESKDSFDVAEHYVS